MIKAFDTHLHLDAFDDQKRYLDEARSAGIDGWVVPGVSPDGWAKILALAEGQPGVHAAPGVHPFSANRYRPENVEELRRLLAHPRAVAVGEVGLDRQAEQNGSAQVMVELQAMPGSDKDIGPGCAGPAHQGSAAVLEVMGAATLMVFAARHLEPSHRPQPVGSIIAENHPALSRVRRFPGVREGRRQHDQLPLP